MDYLRPRSLDEAVGLLARGGLRIAAGCTDLFPATQAPLLPGAILDISAIEALSGISQSGRHWRIGAATTWSAIARATLPPAFSGLQQAARQIGAIQIQNAGTIGGNLCNASPAADGVPPLLTLNASVKLAGPSGHRVLPLAAFITGVRRTAARPDELLTAILIPETAIQGSAAFEKLGARKSLVISIVMAAARVSVRDGQIVDAALAIGACSPVARRMTGVEAALAGRPADDWHREVTPDRIAEALTPIADIRADAAYRLEAARELALRAIARALQAQTP